VTYHNEIAVACPRARRRERSSRDVHQASCLAGRSEALTDETDDGNLKHRERTERIVAEAGSTASDADTDAVGILFVENRAAFGPVSIEVAETMAFFVRP
jgi:hypothetical protein